MDADFLLTRAADLVVLGVRLQDVTVDGSTTPATAVAGPAARIVLYLPPQHIVEEERQDAPPADWQARSQLAGVSRLAFALQAGIRVRLDAADILASCLQLVSQPGPAGPFDTAIEMPWHLAFSAVQPNGGTVSSLHASEQISSPGGVTALWLSRLGVATDAHGAIIDRGDPARPLELLPVDADLANTPNEPFTQPLSQSDRNQIVQLSTTMRPRADRLELTSIGGSLTAGRQWPGFLWSHRATLGRDQEVVIVETGVCYPFGFRAELTTTVKRRPEILGSAEAAALRVASTFRFLETYKRAPDDGLFSRSFPFRSVEVTRATFDDLGALDIAYSAPRPTPELEDLKAQRDVAKRQADEYFAWWSPLVDFTYTLANLVFGGNEDAAKYSEKLGRARELDAEIQAALDQGPPEPGAEALWEDNLARARAELMELEAEIEVLWAGLRLLIGTPRPPETAAWEVVSLGAAADPGSDAAAGGDAAQRWLDLQYVIRDLKARIQSQTNAAVNTDVAGWPCDSANSKLQFPLLLRTGNQQLHLSMPLIFVQDVILPAVDAVPEYASLSDPELPAALDAAWTAAQAGVIALEGAALDIVGSDSPQPQDTHEVHALNILGDLGPDPFTPSLGRPQASDPNVRWSMQVALPALRALGSETPVPPGPTEFPFVPPPIDPGLHVRPGLPLLPGIPVQFDEQFLAIGEQAPALLKPLADIAVNFTSHADRSGGLAALQLKADAISRELGPVQLAGLTSADPSQLIGSEATLLGFKLQDLLRSVPLPVKPPKIVSELLDGQQPVVRMEWMGAALRDLLALRTYPDAVHPERKSTLDLTVLHALDTVSTSCTVNDFALVFPPGGADLLRLDIASLKFFQETTHQQAHPPRLEIGALNMTFLGPLKFVEALQNAVHLAGAGANVQAKPSGVTASFALPVPPVSCGVFNLSNVTFRAGVDVPFGGDPVVVSVAFASRTNPFNLSVDGLGGGGYIDIRIEKDGPRIEASLEFGAVVAINFLVATGEVHALGGVRYLQEGNQITLTGYVRLGGIVEVLGLISVSIELVVQLGYNFETNILRGRATLVVEIDLTLWSDSVEIDSGDWTFKGGLDVGAPFEALAADDGLAVWRRYRSAFVGVTP